MVGYPSEAEIEVLASFADLSLNQEWEGQRNSHLAYEDALEEAGLKRKGERRDQTGGGGRTYKAWLVSLGLIFTQESTGKIKLTLAGEAIMNGDSPVEVLKGQILKYQFPSSFSIGRGVQVSSRFKIRPFRFILKLMADEKIKYLTEEEMLQRQKMKATNAITILWTGLSSFGTTGMLVWKRTFLSGINPLRVQSTQSIRTVI